jgi:hypothetical protein
MEPVLPDDVDPLALLENGVRPHHFLPASCGLTSLLWMCLSIATRCYHAPGPLPFTRSRSLLSVRGQFVVVKDCIPPAELGALRDTFELLVDKQRGIWVAEAKPDDKPQGAWATGAQPRVSGYERLICENTLPALEFALGRTTLGVSQALMRCQQAVPTMLSLMCSPMEDHGPAHWHVRVTLSDSVCCTATTSYQLLFICRRWHAQLWVLSGGC